MSDAPTTAQGWFEQGMKDIDLSRGADTTSEYRGDLEDAVASLDRALALEPNHAGALWQRGLALASLDQHDAALDSFVALSRLKPHDPDVQLAVAQSLAATKQHEAALEAFERTLALRPDEEEARFGRAEQLTALARDEAAIAAWDAVLSAPDNKTITQHGRTVRVLTGDFRRARGRVARACCLARLGRDEARAAFLEAFADRSLWSEVLAEPLRNHEVARAAYASLLETKRDEPAALHRAGQTWLQAKLTRQAIDTYGVLVQLAPKDAQAWFGKAEAHMQADELDEAIADYRKALELWPAFLGASARLRIAEERARARTWKVMGHDTFAKETFVVGEFSTREAAEDARRRKEAASEATQDQALRDTYWVVPPR